MPLHPQAQAFLDDLAAQQPPGWEELSPEEGRAAFAGFGDLFGEGPALAVVQDRTLAGRIPVRCYADSDAAALPALFYFHGGGWVLGDLDTHDALCRHVAKKSGCRVIAVDYRRSPEAVFPAALEDCYDAVRYGSEHPTQLGIDPNRIAVMGDSAGGNLAAAVSLKARDAGGPPIVLQVLIYPVIEPHFETESYREFESGYGLSRASMQWFWQQYLGETAGVVPALASVSKAEPLQGLPQAHLITAEYDVLRDEGEAYADKLRAAGVPTTVKRYDGMIHGFIQFSGIFDVAHQAIDEIAARLRKELGAPGGT